MVRNFRTSSKQSSHQHKVSTPQTSDVPFGATCFHETTRTSSSRLKPPTNVVSKIQCFVLVRTRSRSHAARNKSKFFCCRPDMPVCSGICVLGPGIYKVPLERNGIVSKVFEQDDMEQMCRRAGDPRNKKWNSSSPSGVGLAPDLMVGSL